MKKLSFITLAAALLMTVAGGQNAAAQKFELGARIGVGSQNMEIPDNYYDAKTRLGWNLAAVGRIRLVGFGDGLVGAGLFFQPEVVYSQNRFKANSTVSTLDATSPKSINTLIKTVDVPLLVSAKISIARIHAGPVFNLMNNFTSEAGNLELKPVRGAVGYVVGAGVKLLGFEWDLRYHGDFNKMSLRNVFSKGDSSGIWSDFKSRFSSWSLGVGIMF